MSLFVRDAFAGKLAGVLAFLLGSFTSLVAAIADDGGASVSASGIVHRFQRQPLTRTYFSEGTAVGDLNADGHVDVVYGPHWYAGPDFKQAQEIYPAKPQPMSGYADHFFAWVHDFNADGWNDVLAVGFPGTPAYVYENPGAGLATATAWTKHEVFDWVSNESPAFADLTGDGKPELICTRDGMYGYAVPSFKDFEPWTFRRISGKVTTDKFGHALGFGDIDGDQRNDLLTKDGWFRNPGPDKDVLWAFQPFSFCEPGGADMHAYDVNGDGLNDVITSLDAHAFGLVWWEQQRDASGKIDFQRHLMPSDSAYGVCFSELHSVQLADMNGDGLKDIVTGKTYWSHHRQSPKWDAGPVVYWFELQRGKQGVEWIPHLADDRAGIGRQIVVADVDGNQSLDLVTGGMLGCHVLRHQSEELEGLAYAAAQPKPRRPLKEDLSGLEAAAYMTVPEGFQVQLAAAEPEIHQPVAMAFDHRGRLWVAEAYTYPIRAKEGEGLDKIVILEDTDRDGKFDSRKQFTEGLNLVSGLEVGFGGVWVGAAPYLMFIPDANGDDIPDAEPKILLDGFGYQDTHETLNTFNWGPDGWLYGCHGVFTHSKVGVPGTPDAERTPMNAAVWRYHPIRHQFEVFAWGTSNPWGVDFNDYGQAFATACVIPHLYHIIQGGHYQRQAGEHFNRHVYAEIQTIADHLHYAGNIGDHAWWGHEPDIQTDTSNAGGGHAHCGGMVYLGDNWPQRYRNQVFFNNIHGNRVNMDRLYREGSGYIGKHGDDLLMANDRWFRGINLRCGPDGSVYLIDWYDRNACHRVNPEIWDRTNGRIYNLAYGVPNRESVDLARLDDAALAKLAWHANDWYVRVARRLLQDRAAQGQLNRGAIQDELHKLLVSDDDTRVLRGIWLGHATGLLEQEQLIELLKHASPYVSAWSVQLLCESSEKISARVTDQLDELAKGPQSDPIVRLYLASALQRIPPSQRWGVIEALAARGEDAQDRNLPMLLWYGLEPLVTLDPARAMRLVQSSQLPQLKQFIVRRAAADAVALNTVLDQLAGWPAELQQMALEQINQALEGRVNVAQPESWKTAYEVLSQSSESPIRDQALRLAVAFGDQRAFPALRGLLADGKRPVPERQKALEILVKGRDKELADSLFTAMETPELQSAAIRAMAAVADPRTPQKLLAAWPRLIAAGREDAIATLVSRASFAQPLLDAIDRGEVSRTDVHAFHVRQMVSLNDKSLIERITTSWGKVGTSTEDQQQAISKYQGLLTADRLADADISHGRLMFNKHCSACHQLFGAGEKVGPDLTGSNRADLNYILENLVAPNAVVGKDYQMTLLQLLDGRVVSGLILKETDSALTLKTINDTVVVALNEIEDRKLSDLSLMPNGLLDPLQAEEVRDLVAYLASPVQVPIRGPRPEFDPSTGKVTGAIEGETIKVLETSRGKAGRQDMASFPKDRWSGRDHLWWTGAKEGDRLVLEFEVPATGRYELQAVMTKARDYALVQLAIDDQPLGEAIDLFHTPDVITTGVISLGVRELDAGNHRLRVEIIGKHPEAAPGYMFGLDFLLLKPAAN
ncbi:MAG: FG-GAP-like repeat-containing protein [Blastopirellula sp.]|nr:FG-GAP-like repeat-containing protein [Blastopirellula sp.]